MIEIWRDIKDYEGFYQVSSWGRVKSLERVDNNNRLVKERILKPAKDRGGYLRVALSKNGKMKSCRVHRLVAQAFIPNPDNLPQVNHRDENKENNHVENLEWITAKKNSRYGSRTERIAKAQSRPVYQYTLDGIFIREWPSLMEVERQTGWNSGHISECCNSKRNSAYSYCWEYVEQ